MVFFSHVCAVQRLPAVKESFVWIGLNQKIWKWSPESGSHSELCADQCELRMACMLFLTLLLMQLFMRTLSKVYKMRALGTVSEMITTVPETCYQEGCIWSVALNDEKWWIDFCTLVHQSSGKRKGPVSRIPPPLVVHCNQKLFDSNWYQITWAAFGERKLGGRTQNGLSSPAARMVIKANDNQLFVCFFNVSLPNFCVWWCETSS